MSDTCDTAIEILRLTDDGNRLAPRDLALVESAVNGRLNETGKAAFLALLENARGGYRPPWLHGIEHLTMDHAGNVSWKGFAIEHWSGRELLYGERGRLDALELERRCKALEARGDVITVRAVIWDWPDLPLADSAASV